jgi:hypothetical protein
MICELCDEHRRVEAMEPDDRVAPLGHLEWLGCRRGGVNSEQRDVLGDASPVGNRVSPDRNLSAAEPKMGFQAVPAVSENEVVGLRDDIDRRHRVRILGDAGSKLLDSGLVDTMPWVEFWVDKYLVNRYARDNVTRALLLSAL